MKEYILIEEYKEDFVIIVNEKISLGYTFKGGMTTVVDRYGTIVHSQLMELIIE